MNTIGIDFGTSFCTASRINPSTGKPEAVNFWEIGEQKMPTVVYYSPEGKVVGKAAYDQLENSLYMKEEERNQIINSVVQSIKRKMKKGQKHYLPNGQSVLHEQIIADLLAAIKKDVEIGCFNGNKIEKVILTHPVCFHNWQKEMLKESARMAGFMEADTLEEPIAAALGYASSASDVGNGILVYDFGGGTFDVAYVQRDENGNFRVPVEPEGDPFCGGDDIDMVMYDLVEREAKLKYNRPISNQEGRIDMCFLPRCRKQKESLSLVEFHKFSEVLPPPGLNRLQMQVHRNELNKLIEPIIDKTITKTERLLKKINESNYKIDTAVLIGGSSRIPLVYEKLSGILPATVELRRPMQVDVAVALGAILYNKITQPLKTEPKSVFCIYCGKKITTKNKFCMFCGKPNISYK